MKYARFAAVNVLLMFLVASAHGSPLAPECDACHGENGVSQWDDMPTIAGFSSFALADAMYIYLDRARPCHESKYRRGDTSRPASDMCKAVDALEEKQIEAIADYYAAKPFVAAKQDTDAALVEQGQALHKEHCERCHTEAGSNPADDAGILAGQWMGYLRQSFADYRSGEREQSEKMKVKLDKLDDAQVEALVHYYGSRN